MKTVFVCIYTIGAWLTFFLRCRPMSGFWERNPKAKCYSIQLFVTFAQINTGKCILAILSRKILIGRSVQYLYGCMLCYITHSYHMELANVATHEDELDWYFKSRVLVSLDPFVLHINLY